MMQAHDDQTVIVTSNGKYLTAYTVLEPEENVADAIARAEEFYQGFEPESLPVVAMSWDEFLEKRREHMVGIAKAEKIDADRFFQALEEMPPLKWCHRGGMELFCCLEALTGSWHQQYARWGCDFITKLVDIDDSTTWITKDDFT